MCNFFEPNLTTYVAQPDCIADAYPPDTQKLINDGVTLSGQLYRQTTCEITYGPLNCDFVLKGDNECACNRPCLPTPLISHSYNCINMALAVGVSTFRNSCDEISCERQRHVKGHTP